MAVTWPKFLKRDKNSVLFNNTGEMLFFIPENLFTLKLAFSAGEYQNVFGVLNYCLVDPKGKKGKLKLLKLPTRFLTKPYQIDKLKDVKLLSSSKPQDYRIFRYRKGDPVIVDMFVPEDIDNVEDFVNLALITGHLSNGIPYDKVQDLFMENIAINGSNYNVSAQLFGIALSECARAVGNDSVSFRLSGETNMNNYNLMGVKKVSRLITPYSAFTSENFMESITHAMMNDKKIDQPLERVMTGD